MDAEALERTDQVAVAAKLEDLAEAGGVELTPHAIAIERSIDAVDRIELEFATLQTGAI